jgi:hypothetical protein
MSRYSWDATRARLAACGSQRADYEVAYQFKDKVIRALRFLIFRLGLGRKTTGCLNRLSALGWRIGGGPLTVVQSPETGSFGFRRRPERRVRTHRLWTAVVSALRRRLARQSLASSKLRDEAWIDGWARTSSRRARWRTARQRACARRQPSRRIGRASFQSPRPTN